MMFGLFKKKKTTAAIQKPNRDPRQDPKIGDILAADGRELRVMFIEPGFVHVLTDEHAPDESLVTDPHFLATETWTTEEWKIRVDGAAIWRYAENPDTPKTKPAPPPPPKLPPPEFLPHWVKPAAVEEAWARMFQARDEATRQMERGTELEHQRVHDALTEVLQKHNLPKWHFKFMARFRELEMSFKPVGTSSEGVHLDLSDPSPSGSVVTATLGEPGIVVETPIEKPIETPPVEDLPDTRADVISALRNLGYKKREAEATVNKTYDSSSDLPTNIAKALRELSPATKEVHNASV